MAKPLRPNDLMDMLGRPMEMGPTYECEWPEDSVAEGLGKGTAFAATFALVMNYAVLDAAGLSVWLASRGSGIRVAAAGGEDLRWWQPTSEGVLRGHRGPTLEGDLGHGPIVVAAPSGWVFEVSRPRPGGPVRFDPSTPIDASTLLHPEQLHGWVTRCHDQWLQSFVNGYVGDSTDVTRLLIGAGRLCRLEVDSSSVSAELPPWKLEQITGDVLTWAEDLSEGRVLALDGLIANTIDRAAALLHELWNRSGADGEGAAEPMWQQDFLELCQDRDDIEGLLTLRDRAADSPGHAEVALHGLDRRGNELVALVADLLVPSEDPRLLRVAAAEHSVWWVAPVLLQA